MTEALQSSEKGQWQEAMRKEMESIQSNEVWDLVELLANRKPVGSKWVFKRKFKADGSVERHKARLVAQGFSQKKGLDYDETFSPVFAILWQSLSRKVDITAAFLNGRLEEEVFMKQPEGLLRKGKNT